MAGTLPPRLSMRATSSWPVKQPLVKLTEASMTAWPASAGIVASVSSAPIAGTPLRMRSASKASQAGHGHPGGQLDLGPEQVDALDAGHSAGTRRPPRRRRRGGLGPGAPQGDDPPVDAGRRRPWSGAGTAAGGR